MNERKHIPNRRIDGSGNVPHDNAYSANYRYCPLGTDYSKEAVNAKKSYVRKFEKLRKKAFDIIENSKVTPARLAVLSGVHIKYITQFLHGDPEHNFPKVAYDKIVKLIEKY